MVDECNPTPAFFSSATPPSESSGDRALYKRQTRALAANIFAELFRSTSHLSLANMHRLFYAMLTLCVVLPCSAGKEKKGMFGTAKLLRRQC
ncbi:hypothetical protein LSAT2_004333 [Lamellibrachia satsuma]|nr:hypothetical protein LSAT2_004333 [Lamellibrachia satsuma]